ncbi:MAG TPA: Mrp/NBP35 family ATP-binding protein [Blastocatellia bacterium]|nr:Mrp/NBP35 family ATP-binding protein [Blastocatellia bacterium]HMX24755.1 Mrp/NBP35 family ATP-binding protein [Blastocatellia bacterium]HMY74544.1 Mrp/NBP35 family ATP-binding protein [Blastocatellia bacterium]HMZ22723.1 Mrp/NBP35 family ATP-binding protein [Blastocatellia bacterium]HNG29597.1 Mrp/NBP35 family ATP-binding protein [Blastocatellia bacterium]
MTETATQEITQEVILNALRTVKDPDLHKDIVTLNMIRDMAICGGIVSFRFVLTTPACPVRDQLKFQAEKAVMAVPGVERVEVKMDAEVPKARGAMDKAAIAGIGHIIAVSSGKGGVGKSTVAVNLAVSLSLMGARVGIVDTDIYGPNVPIMMGGRDMPLVRGEKLLPPVYHGVKTMSIGLLNPGDKAIVWRGPMLSTAVQQFLRDVEWGELDYLVVDMPPGTGDVQLSMAQMVSIAGAVLVTTPQEVALGDVRKAYNMFDQLHVPVLGVVENMSYFECAHGEKYFIFGNGGGEALAARYDVPFLGAVPIAMSIREGGDLGVPVVVSDPQSPQAKAFMQVAQNVAAQISIAAIKSNKTLPVLNLKR